MEYRRKESTPYLTLLPNSEKAKRGGSYHQEAADPLWWYEQSDPFRIPMADVDFRCVRTPEATQRARVANGGAVMCAASRVFTAEQGHAAADAKRRG